MDTIIFGVLFALVYVMFTSGDRRKTLILFAVAFVLTAALLKYHVSDALKLSF